MNRNIRQLVYFMLSGFMILLIYMTYIQAVESDSLITHPNNKRLLKWENNIDRGTIYDRNGQILAETISINGIKQRVYTLKEAAGHLIGYNSIKYGQSGIEKAYNAELLGVTNEEMLRRFLNRSVKEPMQGNNITLSIDEKLQRLAYKLLGDNKGGIVSLNPKTGEILALASKPGFDPEKVDNLWKDLNTNANSPLLNRVTQGLYPPGSTLKVMTGAGIAKDSSLLSQEFTCPGYLMVGNYKLNCTAIHGRVNFYQAMAKSCNTAFGTMGLQLGKDEFTNLADKFGFGLSIPFDLPVAPSRIAPLDQLTKQELAQSAIGQGKILVSPMHMALIAGGIANDGVIMRPHVVDKVTNPGGQTIKEISSQRWLNIMDKNVADIIKTAMVGVTEKGTGKAAALKGITVAGKTGSAQNPHGITHAWYIGFAPADNPQIAVAIVLENRGLGGKEAAPLAKALFAEALQ